MKKIGEILVVGSGRDYKHLRSGNIPVYGSGGYMLSVDNYLYDGDSVAIGRKGTIDHPQLLNGKFWTVDTLFYTYNFKQTNPKFIFALFQKINWKKYNEASGVPSLSKTTIESIKVHIPSEEEQKKITDSLTAIDKKIALLEEKIVELQNFKHGVMQKIFAQQIRFTRNDGSKYHDWSEERLDGLLDVRSDRNQDNKLTEVLSVAKNAGVINQIEHLGRSFSASDISNYKKVLPNDVIYTKSPTSDFPYGIIKQNKLGRSGVVSVLYGVYKPKNTYIGFILDSYFSVWQNTYNYLDPIVQKGAKNTINIGDKAALHGRPFLFPRDKEEQQKIAEFLSSLDQKISLAKYQAQQAKSFKKALLQRMFV